MFYSHQILARKGPLATVWMAAHLQHRLKKPHYNSVDINTTVDRIIFPEAPIALRMSGHLLLGVVRIYSKKVDYLYHDCNDAMVKVSKAFTPAEVNLTEAAAIAPSDDVTLPERFELDAMNLDDYTFTDRGVDNYMRSPEDITLPDSTPLNMDHYVAVTFEDIDMTPLGSSLRGLDGDQERDVGQPATASEGAAPSNWTEFASEGLQGVSSSGVEPMEEDIHHVQPVDLSERFTEPTAAGQTSTLEAQGISDLGPINQPEATTERTHEHQSPQSIEVMRHTVFESILPDLPLPNQSTFETEQQTAEVSDKDKEFVSPLGEELLEPEQQPPSFQPQYEQMKPAGSEESPNLLGSHLSFGQGSIELAVRSTPIVPQVHAPPVEAAQRKRKRKLYDEKAIVLSNKALKDALNDTSKIVRQKRRLPDTVIGSWRLEKLLRKEHIFAEPLLAGMCEDLQDIYTDLSVKPYLARTDEPAQERMDQHTSDAVHQPDISPGTAAQRVEGEPGGNLNIPAQQEGNLVRSPEAHATPAPDIEPEQSPRNASDSGSGQGGRAEESPMLPAELDMEVEHLRRHEGDVGTSMMPEFTPSTAVMRSPTRGDDIPAVSAGSFRSGQEGDSGFGPGLLPTPDLASTAETLGTEAVAASYQEQIQQPDFGDVPELMKSPATEELRFLEADSSLSEFEGTQDVNSLSVRSRAVAQYLKGLSPGTPTLVDQMANISLNDILKNKSKKICARMFYETLVLKSFDLIDVEQKEKYGDITLKLTSVMKAQL
ncbi:unnamed protein product [Rhodiola kirilowii]